MATDPHALTPAELAYANSGGDVDALVKEGLIPEPGSEGEPPAPKPEEAEPQLALTPEPPAEPEEEDQPELDPKTGKPKTRGRWVSKGALDAERKERQRLAQELNSTKENWARLEERFKVFQEALNTPEPEQEEFEEPLPDPEQDIIGFNRGLAARVERQFQRFDEALGGINQRLGQFGDQTAAEREQNQIVNAYRQDATAFTQRQPDFGEAYRYLISSRDIELQAAGYDDPAERNRLIMADEQALAVRALQAKASPAERVYALAKARGYKAPNGKPNGQQQQPALAAPNQPNVTDEIARLQRGQEASLSLSNVGGGKPKALSIEDILAMPENVFRDFARKNPDLLEQMAGKGQ